jgi:hypothetical protein
VRIGERHGAVVAEEQVEAGIGEREFLRARPDQREPDAGLLEVRTGGSELVRAEVQARNASAAHRDLDAELARATAELQRAKTRNVPKRLDLVFGEVADAPGKHAPSVQVRSMALLVRLAICFPRCEVRADVLPAHRSSQPPSRP